MVKKFTTKEFVAKAKKVHGDKYDYSKVEYINSRTPVTIICPIHGEFQQTPADHLMGHGCRKCGRMVVAKTLSNKTNSFIEKAKEIHGDRYDYSKVNYINNITKIKIHCNVCGCEFEQAPNNHLNGQGCPNCFGTKKKTTEEFIEEAKKIHGNKYDYSKVEYKGSKLPVIIICKKHGEFKQQPNSHLNGQGCPICKSSKLEQEMRMFLTEKNIKFEEQKRFDWLGLQSLDFYLPDYKIGIECQGRQHYESSSYFGGIKQFIIQRERDNRKKKLCTENHVKIIYYTHYEMAINNKNTFENKEKILKTIY